MRRANAFLIIVALTVGFACQSGGSGSTAGRDGATAAGGSGGKGGASGATGGAGRTEDGAAGGGGIAGAGGAGGQAGGGGPDAGSDAGLADNDGAAPDHQGGDGGPAFSPCPADGSPCKILPLGDSITWGNASGAVNTGGSYRAELFRRATGDGKHFTFVGSQLSGPVTVDGKTFPRNNEGYPGWTIAQISGIATTAKALKDTPQIVLLHAGTNDMFQMPPGAPDRLGQLIDKIAAALPDALLVVAQIIPIQSKDGLVVTYNAAVPAVVQQRADAGKHVLLLDLHTGFPSSNGFADDDHPNDSVGYPWMGDKWYGVIATYLR